MRGGINIRTAEILTGTKTFQKAKTCIYNTDGMPVYVDIPTEYGKTWLKDLVTGNASICLELDQELKTVDEWITWLERICQKTFPEIKMTALRKIAAEEKLTPVIRRYLLTEMVSCLTKQAGEGGLLSISGISYLQSKSVLFFVWNFVKSLAENMRVVIWEDMGEREHTYRSERNEISEGRIVRITPGEMLFSKEDIEYLAAQRIPGWTESQKKLLTEKLWMFFGGLPAGICYALDLLAEDGKGRSLSYICKSSNHPLYERFGRNCLARRFQEEEFGILNRLSEQSVLTEASVRENLKMEWAPEYLNFFKEQGVILYDSGRGEYWMPGLFRNYMQGKTTKGTLHEQVGEADTWLAENPVKVQIHSFGSFQVAYRGKEVRWRTRKTKELFAFLFDKQGKGVSRDVILGNLWADLDENRARNIFYTTMTYLRKNLKEAGISDLLLCQKGMYRLDMRKVESDYQTLLSIKAQIDRENWTELKKMPDIRTLCQGAYLEFCSEEWTYGIQSYVSRILHQCLRSLGSYQMRIGKMAEAAEYLELFLREEPYSEDITKMLITAYGKLGDYKSAHRVYKEFEKLFQQEFGEEPGEEIKKALKNCRKERCAE